VILLFPDKRQIFAECLSRWRGKNPPLKINKRNYSTANLVGLTYGTVLELNTKTGLHPLPDGEDIIPADLVIDDVLIVSNGNGGNGNGDGDDDNDGGNGNVNGNGEAKLNLDEKCNNDNRNLVDDNKSQAINHDDLHKMKSDPSLTGAEIVSTIIQNSSTFQSKTSFSKAKYIKKKQMKYQPRCRLVRCTPATICRAMFLRDERRIMRLRDDSLGQILSYANLCAGAKTMVFDGCMGMITGSCAQRMGGYGSIHSIYTGNAPSILESLARFNLSFVEYSSIRWLHAGQIFHDDDDVHVHSKEESATADVLVGEDLDLELAERKKVIWPCPLQEHTQNYLINMESEQKRIDFLAKRCGRFARKLTRPTQDEVLNMLVGPEQDKKCDSIIVACQYEPKTTLLQMLPYLETSCPFVVFYEYMEPLVELFHELQQQKLAINLRLSDTWMREYQVLPNRTHPNMTMSQSGGFILTGIKLCPIHGKNELDEDVMKEIRAEFGGRRGKKRKDSSGKKRAVRKRGR